MKASPDEVQRTLTAFDAKQSEHIKSLVNTATEKQAFIRQARESGLRVRNTKNGWVVVSK